MSQLQVKYSLIDFRSALGDILQEATLRLHNQLKQTEFIIGHHWIKIQVIMIEIVKMC